MLIPLLLLPPIGMPPKLKEGAAPPPPMLLPRAPPKGDTIDAEEGVIPSLTREASRALVSASLMVCVLLPPPPLDGATLEVELDSSKEV